MLTYVPGKQVVHAEHELAFVAVEKVPLAQAVHVRSVVAEPEDTTRSPALQVLQGTHAVTALPS